MEANHTTKHPSTMDIILYIHKLEDKYNTEIKELKEEIERLKQLVK